MTECPVCKNPPEQFILHTDYIFSISPDCRAPAKCIHECKTVNPGGLQYKLAETEKTMVMQSEPERIYLCLARN